MPPQPTVALSPDCGTYHCYVSLPPPHKNGKSSSVPPHSSLSVVTPTCEAPHLQLLSKPFLSPASLSPKALGVPPVEARVPSLTAPHPEWSC